MKAVGLAVFQEDCWRKIAISPTTANRVTFSEWSVSGDGRYVLGPPVIPAQENHPPRETPYGLPSQASNWFMPR